MMARGNDGTGTDMALASGKTAPKWLVPPASRQNFAAAKVPYVHLFTTRLKL
jgi:hypothetical protein